MNISLLPSHATRQARCARGSEVLPARVACGRQVLFGKTSTGPHRPERRRLTACPVFGPDTPEVKVATCENRRSVAPLSIQSRSDTLIDKFKPCIEAGLEPFLSFWAFRTQFFVVHFLMVLEEGSMPPSLNALLKSMVEQGGSDLHLTISFPTADPRRRKTAATQPASAHADGDQAGRLLDPDG